MVECSQGNQKMRVVFFGSPEFAAPTLVALAESGQFEVCLVVTQGAKAPSPVEIVARARGLPVYKPVSLRDAASRQPLVEKDADLFVVAAFGLIFGSRTLAIPKYGAINVHPSLLPKYRGASPIMAAIESGDRETGVSLMLMDSGIDTGAVVSVEHVVVDDDDTTESLGARLAEVASAQAVRDIPRWVAGQILAVPQTSSGASLTRTLQKADGEIDWNRSATEIERHVRAMWPWPRAWTTIDGSLLQIHKARIIERAAGESSPGTVQPSKREIVVTCGDGALQVDIVEPAGRRAMTAREYLNGRRSPIGRFGSGLGAEKRPPLIQPISLQCG